MALVVPCSPITAGGSENPKHGTLCLYSGAVLLIPEALGQKTYRTQSPRKKTGPHTISIRMKNTIFTQARDAIDQGDIAYFQTEFKGEWINFQDTEGGWTLLHYASSRFVPPIVKCLLTKYNADPNVADNHGDVALHFAAQSNDLETLHLLLANKALPIRYNAAQKSPLNLATCHGALDCAKTLVQFHLKNEQEKENYLFHSVLIDAVTYGQLALLNLFIDLGLDIHIKDRAGYSLTHLAVMESQPEILACLIKHGVKVGPLPKHDNRALEELAPTKRIRSILRQALNK